MPDKKELRIIFFGTPAFAATSLKAIHDSGYNIVAVVTAPDKPAGRGYKLQESAVKMVASGLGIPVLQPANLKSEGFIEALRAFGADIQIVIAFRMLPEVVWNMPRLGTFNLHASMLPAYRGAAPINRAIMNGETHTGISIFFLKHDIDTGNILLQEQVEILPEDDAGTLHDKLMLKGAGLVCRSLELICKGNIKLTPQVAGDYPHAPKIFTEDCRINWNIPARNVVNHIRGLSPYPAAFTEFSDKKLKVYKAVITNQPSIEPGLIEVKDHEKLLAHSKDFVLELTDIQPEGKRRMTAREYINGLKFIA